MRAALKAVRLTPEGTVVQDDAPRGRTHRDTPIGSALPPRSNPRARRGADRRTGASAGPPERTRSEPPPLNSNYPTPAYIPQAEYAQMLRDQKAAEKAAVAAAAELRRLAEVEELDELAEKEEFSDWTS